MLKAVREVNSQKAKSWALRFASTLPQELSDTIWSEAYAGCCEFILSLLDTRYPEPSSEKNHLIDQIVEYLLKRKK